MRNIYLLCGVIGSGKSTWAKENARELNAHIVCKDNIREMIYGKYKFEQTQEFLVDNIAWAAINCILSCGGNVIIDDCYSALTIQHRRETVERIRMDFIVNVIAVNFLNTSNNVERRMEDHRGYTYERWKSVYEGMIHIFNPASMREIYLNEIHDHLIAEPYVPAKKN